VTGKRFPWAQVMHAGLGRLKLSPKDFWAMTPKELAAALPPPGVAALTRTDLMQMMKEHPDG
jgi:uncharacterized phage protein (TIGR02216 family)